MSTLLLGARDRPVSTLLVGATGFLGSHVAARMPGASALVRPSSSRGVLPPGMATRVGDLDQALPLDGIDTLVYCASMGFGQVPPLVPRLEAAGIRRAVFVSTTAIFTSLPAPSKDVRIEAERVVQESGLEWTILRPTMIYGTAGDRNISRLLRYLRRWPVFPLCGNALWQPVHADDVADAILAVLDSPASVRRAYNVPGAAPIRFSDLVRQAARAVGRRRVLLLPVPQRAAVLGARLTHVVSPEQIQRLAEDKAFDYADAARDFRYAPRKFEQGVAAEARALFAAGI